MTELRDQNTKYFRNSDGTITSETSLDSRHYKDSNGKWNDISNRLINSTEPGFAMRNSANSFETNFANGSRANFLANIKLDQNSSLAWGLENANKVEATITDESVTFPEILPNTDLEFSPHSDGLKEIIILKNASSPSVFNFTLTLKGLTPLAQEDGSILLKDSKTGEEKLVLPKPFMFDNNHQYSEAIAMKLEQTDNKMCIRSC